EKNCLSEDYLLNYKIESYDDILTMLDDLGNKNVDGVLISLPMWVLLVENKGIYSVPEEGIKSNKEFGIVFTKGSALKEEVDKILEEIKEDGTYDDIYNKWFNY
ncbi:MAG: transporter substrate-binding domain-containing protein, partial [Actinobacteria bacterium]|nr:transporter substrate-binding domain-containing protein [Actinomycetota bacterium]